MKGCATAASAVTQPFDVQPTPVGAERYFARPVNPWATIGIL